MWPNKNDVDLRLELLMDEEERIHLNVNLDRSGFISLRLIGRRLLDRMKNDVYME